MTPGKLLRYAAPAGFVTLGWKGERPPEHAVRLQSGEEVMTMTRIRLEV
jgi:hypothetical protein